MQRVTVKQLETILQSHTATKESDGKVAQFLGSLTLTERLTKPTLAQLQRSMNLGPDAAQALDMLADRSAFLDPPASELPGTPQPPAAEQQKMLNQAVNFVAVTLRHLPDFLATRATRSYDNTPLTVTHSGWSPAHTDLHLAGTFNQEIGYRDGKEITDHRVLTSTSKTKQSGTPPGLTSSGEFGPVLATILRDVSHGKIAWSHWEKTDGGLLAVFHYQVPKTASHYQVNFCCVRPMEAPSAYGGNSLGNGVMDGGSGDPDNSYRGMPAYHGSLALDPKTGAIRRITIDPELSASGPISRSAIRVEYGPVKIAGKTYFCPVRSLALSLSLSKLPGDFGARPILRINEVTFLHYHRFGSTSRILPAQ